MTYGQLIDGAKRLLQQTLNDPTVHSAADALLVCDARARLYRVLAGGIALHLNAPRSAGRRRFLEYQGDGIKWRELTLLEHLRTDLLKSAGTASDTWQQPSTQTPAGTRLARAADLAGAGFDLLAAHVLPLDVPMVPSSSLLSRGGTRVTARDAVQLARAAAHLDGKLERLIRGFTFAEIDAASRDRLVATAEDCKRVTRQGIREFAATIHKTLRSPARRVVDDLDLALPPSAMQSPHRPTSAAGVVAVLRDAVHRNPERLSVLDLAALASIGSRVCALSAYACAPVGGPIGPALAAARNWQAVFHELRSFVTTSRGKSLPPSAHAFRTWADPLIRSGSQADFAQTEVWLPATQAMTTDLADLAYSVTRAIERKITAGELLVPFDTRTRGREHLFRAANPTDDQVVQLREASGRAFRSTRDLARDVHRLDPSTHPKPDRIATALKRIAPRPDSAAGRTPPPSRPARPGPRRRR